MLINEITLWNPSVIHYKTGGKKEKMKVQINKFLLITLLLEFLTSKSSEGFNLLSTKENKRHSISHLKCRPRESAAVTSKGQAGRSSNFSHFPSQVIIHIKGSHPLPSPWTLHLFQSVIWKAWEFWTPAQQVRTKLQDHELPLSTFRAQSSGPEGIPM